MRLAARGSGMHTTTCTLHGASLGLTHDDSKAVEDAKSNSAFAIRRGDHFGSKPT
jgi:hypothetical protein